MLNLKLNLKNTGIDQKAIMNYIKEQMLKMTLLVG